MCRDVSAAERFVEFLRDVVAIFPIRTIVVGNVACRLLQIGHKPAPLENLRRDIRHALACEVYAAKLCDGVVTVFRENPSV